MADSNLNFAAQVGKWVEESQARMEAVFREAAQDVIAEMQKVGPSVTNPDANGGGNMPVASGFLRSSLQVGINSDPVPASTSNPNPKMKYSYVASLAIAGAEIGDTVVASYSANYAPMVEYGTSKMAARGFVRQAAAQWPAIVDRVVARLANQSLKATVDEASANRGG